jgi:hypothetical protein
MFKAVIIMVYYFIYIVRKALTKLVFAAPVSRFISFGVSGIWPAFFTREDSEVRIRLMSNVIMFIMLNLYI